MSTMVFSCSFTTVPNGTFTEGEKNISQERLSEDRLTMSPTDNGHLCSKAETHMNVGWAAVPTITVLAAP